MIFSQKLVAATAVERRNGVFQTSLDFEKKKSVSEPFSVFFENNSP